MNLFQCKHLESIEGLWLMLSNILFGFSVYLLVGVILTFLTSTYINFEQGKLNQATIHIMQTIMITTWPLLLLITTGTTIRMIFQIIKKEIENGKRTDRD